MSHREYGFKLFTQYLRAYQIIKLNAYLNYDVTKAIST